MSILNRLIIILCLVFIATLAGDSNAATSTSAFQMSQQILILDGEENLIDGSLGTYILTGWTSEAGFPESLICGESLTFEAESEVLEIELQLVEASDTRCRWRADFPPNYFAPGEFEITGIWCSPGSCQERTAIVLVFYETNVEGINRAELAELSVTAAAPGEIVSISGSGFTSNLSRISVLIDESNAAVLSASSQAVTLQIPQNLPDGETAVFVGVDGEFSNPLELQIDASLSPRDITEADERAGFMLGQVLIFLAPDSGPADLEQLVTDYGLASYQSFPLIGVVRLRLPEVASEQETRDLLDSLEQDARIDAVFFNYLTVPSGDELQLRSIDPLVAQQTWLADIGYENIYGYSSELGSNAVIAVIDTGMDMNSSIVTSELYVDPTAKLGINFAKDRDEDPTATDLLFGHGTSVASIASAQGLNGIQGSGTGIQSRIIPVKAFMKTRSGRPGGTMLWLANAISYGYLMEVDVINMSLEDASSMSSEEFYTRVLDNLEDGEFSLSEIENARLPVLVAATGNDGHDGIACPACEDRIVAVGSIVSSNGQWVRSDFSNYGPRLDFVAEGENILATGLNGVFGAPESGTSFAAPQIAGLIAVILGESDVATRDNIVQKLAECFVQDIGDVGKDEAFGWGRLYIPPVSSATQSCQQLFN